MPIPLIHEDDMDMSLLRALNISENLLEECFFCYEPTRFWHHAKNQPICPSCAATRSASELPVWRGTSTEPTPKPLSKKQIQLRAQNDHIRLTEARLRHQLHQLLNDKRTLHKKMTDAKMVIPNPIQ
jgi:hypothetical protein